jgi:putative endonuclease
LLLNREKLLDDPALLGQWGERYCEKFLKRQGLKILTRNFSCRSGEIDLIAVDRDTTIVFVEVRTRADVSFGPPEASITTTKKKKLLLTARYFLATHNIADRPFRFDIVAIVLNKSSQPKINHYKNAFVP